MNDPHNVIEMHVTPRRLGEMYANTVINLVDTLQNGHFELAKKARRAPHEILDAIPPLQRDGLLDFIAGVANQCEDLLDMLAQDTTNPYPGIGPEAASHDGEQDDAIAAEITALQTQVSDALELAKAPVSVVRGFVDLGGAGFELTLLRARRNLGSDNLARLDALETRIDSVLGRASRKNLNHYISGQRHAQLFRATRSDEG